MTRRSAPTSRRHQHHQHARKRNAAEERLGAQTIYGDKAAVIYSTADGNLRVALVDGGAEQHSWPVARTTEAIREIGGRLRGIREMLVSKYGADPGPTSAAPPQRPARPRIEEVAGPAWAPPLYRHDELSRGFSASYKPGELSPGHDPSVALWIHPDLLAVPQGAYPVAIGGDYDPERIYRELLATRRETNLDASLHAMNMAMAWLIAQNFVSKEVGEPGVPAVPSRDPIVWLPGGKNIANVTTSVVLDRGSYTEDPHWPSSGGIGITFYNFSGARLRGFRWVDNAEAAARARGAEAWAMKPRREVVLNASIAAFGAMLDEITRRIFASRQDAEEAETRERQRAAVARMSTEKLRELVASGGGAPFVRAMWSEELSRRPARPRIEEVAGPAWAPPPFAPRVVAEVLAEPTPAQQQTAQFVLRKGTLVGRPGFVPLRLDAHPDGSIRVVMIYTRLPPGVEPPDAKPLAEGHMEQYVIPRERPEGWQPRRSPFDPAPAWRVVSDFRFGPPSNEGKPFTKVLADEVYESGYKQPAKVRAVRDAHWRAVATSLQRRRPVAEEVLADYPALASFYADNIVLAQSLAERQAAQAADDNPADPDVTVSWSVQEGLLLRTRGKEQKIIDAIRAVRRLGMGYGFNWSKRIPPDGAWYRPQSVGVSEPTTDIRRIVAALREQGMVVAVKTGEVSKLGEANQRRQEHKLWRSDVHAGRAEAAMERGEAREERAAQIVDDIPVGVSVARAARAEARAERHEQRAVEEYGRAEDAANAAINLAHTAARYDTTVELTRREVEQRADEFGQLFVRKIKGITGASRLVSGKTDNRSEYSLTWAVYYPANTPVARVLYDGRNIVVEVWPSGSSDGIGYLHGNRHGSVVALRADVSTRDASAIFDLVAAALPKVEREQKDEGAERYTTVTEANEKITEYAQRRASSAFDDVFKPSTRGERFGARREYNRTFERTLGLSAIRGTGTYAFPVDPNFELEPAESRPDAPIVFKIERVTGNNESLRTARTLVGTLDLTGLTVAEAWARIVATVKSLMTGRHVEEFYAAPKAAPKPRAKPTAAPLAPVVLPVEQLAADVARASALALAAEKSERVAATAGAARQARQALTESRREVTEKAGLIEAARTAGTAHGFFPTPPSLARHVADLAIIRPGETALEPSAGMGALIEELVNRGATVAAIEYQPDRARFLAETWGRSGVDVRSGDFLAVPPTPTFDVVLMNPPFATESTRRADALHVLHALGFVRPGGRLVAIMSPGSVTADDKPRAALHEGLRGWGVTWEPVEPGRFRTSGTNVASVILVAHRPEAKQNRRHYR